MLVQAYSHGIFPWFSDGQPILWWSTDPRMALDVTRFKLHRSLKQVLQRFQRDADCEIRIDSAFEQVINACAQTDRSGPVAKPAEKSPAAAPGESPEGAQGTTSGTWIVPDMVNAYLALHRAGHAHSVEVWVKGELVGGLYCVALGKAVFGESMFSWQSDASKIALAALVSFCRFHQIRMIDCQQNTRHLASLGAAEMPRSAFVSHVAASALLQGPQWQFLPLYWNEILPKSTSGP
jgi:leucyl/phenylalanyl-tRNA---protein transferase